MTDAATLERLVLGAWPARERSMLHGWTLLADRGETGRVNAIAPLVFDGPDLDAAIDDAIAWQTARGNGPCFKIADGACAPAALPQVLAARGWRAHTETLVMTASLHRALCRLHQGSVIPDAHAVCDPEPWGDEAQRLNAWVPGSRFVRPGMTEILLSADYSAEIDAVVRETSLSAAEYAERSGIAQRTPQPRRFAALSADGETAAVGLSVVTGDHAAIFLMRTAPAHRRKGLARTIVAALLAWAQREGATHAYLQVEAANAPAIALYRGCAFESAYSYRYWRPEGAP